MQIFKKFSGGNQPPTRPHHNLEHPIFPYVRHCALASRNSLPSYWSNSCIQIVDNFGWSTQMVLGPWIASFFNVRIEIHKWWICIFLQRRGKEKEVKSKFQNFLINFPVFENNTILLEFLPETLNNQIINKSRIIRVETKL